MIVKINFQTQYCEFLANFGKIDTSQQIHTKNLLNWFHKNHH